MFYLLLLLEVQSCLHSSKIFIQHNYPCVMPIEYQLEQPGHTIMYVPIRQMIQEWFKNTDILNKITASLANMHHAPVALISLRISYFQEWTSSYHSSYIFMTLKLPTHLANHVKFTNFVLYTGYFPICHQNTDQHYTIYS